MWRAGKAGLPEVLRVSDSSPDTAETSFRELDEVFLQPLTCRGCGSLFHYLHKLKKLYECCPNCNNPASYTQTRIWLGQVLHVRFDDKVAIADLLADGEMLFQVSKKVWKMLLKKHEELKHSKVYIYERTSSGRIDSRYMPYPKVDSFLKICQILGLTGVDVFSPSDVVEKRDTRRVCMCIRSLSKKARSKQLNVPDFDIVTYTIAMPTNLVDGIRKYLELSHFCSSKFNDSSPWNGTRETCRQKARCGQHYQYYDSESDEADSISNDLELQSSLSNGSSDVSNISCTVRETSQGIASFVEENVPESVFMGRFEDNNHYEDVGGHQEETLIQTAQFFSSSLHSEIPTYHGTRICSADVGEGCGLLSKSNRHSQQFDNDNDFLGPALEIPVGNLNLIGGFGSNKKDFWNRFKAELNIDSIEVETSSPTSTIASSVEVAPCKKNCRSPDSVLVSFLDHMVPDKVDSKNSTREHVLERKDDSMENRFDDKGIFVKPKGHRIGNGVDGDDDDLSEIESLSANNSSSLDPSVSDFQLEESYYSMASSEVERSLTLFADKKNEFAENPGDPLSKESQDAMDRTGYFAKNRLVLPSKCDDLTYTSGIESTASLFPSLFTKNRFECWPFSGICPLCNDQKIKYRCSKISSEKFVYQVKMGSKEKPINAELPLGWDHEKEERKVYRYSTLRNFRNKLLSWNLNESEGESKKHEVSPEDHSCQQSEIEKDMSVEDDESLCKETCFSVHCSIGDGKVSKYISGCVEVYSAAAVNSGNDHTPSIPSTLSCIAFVLSNEQKVPDTYHKPENIDRSIYNRVSSVNDFSLVRLNLHHTSPTASHNILLIMETHCLDKKVSVNLEMSLLGYGKISSFVNRMAKKLHIYADCLDILACTASIPGSVRDDFVLSSCPLCIEEIQITKGKAIELDNQMSCHINDDRTSIMSLESVEKTKKVDVECGRKPLLMPCPSVEAKGRASGSTRKPGNQVMKSVAGVVALAGALAIFFHFRQRRDRHRSERVTTPLQSRRPNHGVFTKARVLDNKSRSLYPGEKFNF